MAEFTSLPQVVSSQIITCLPAADISRISRASKRLRETATPSLLRLYNTIFLRNDRGPLRRLRLLLRSIISCPELAAHVHELSIVWKEGTSDDQNIDTAQQIRHDCTLISHAAEELELDITLRTALVAGNYIEEARFILLLHLLPNLDILHFRPPPSDRQLFIDGIFNELPSRTTRLPLGLKSLHTLTRYEGQYLGFGVNLLIPCLQLPSLRKLSTSMLYEPGRDPESPNPPTSTVTDLNIYYSFISPEALKAVLRHVPGLKRLSYETRDDLGHTSVVPFLGTHFESVFRSVKDSLEYLRIDIDIDNEPVLASSTVTIGVLHDYPVLKGVTAQFSVLLGCWPQERPLLLEDVLPVVIEEFRLIYTRMWPMNACLVQLIGLLGRKDTKTPSLSMIAISKWKGDRVELQDLESMCQRMNVALDLTECILD